MAAQKKSSPKWRALVIDDQPICHEAMKIILQKGFDDVEVLAHCKSGTEGLAAIKKHKPDLLFLDVEMPKMNAFEMLEKIGDWNFEIIFTTASDQYTIQALRASALDYLLKPVDKKEMRTALNRLVKKHNHPPQAEQIELLAQTVVPPHKPMERIALSTTEGLKFITLANLIRCESDSNYTIFHMTGGEKLMIAKTLKSVQELLAPAEFCRIHASNLVNMKHIARYVRGAGGYVIMSDGNAVNVSREKKENFLQQFSKI